MKVVFAGPSLHGVPTEARGIVRRPPAGQGDVYRAVRDGARAIGLIDGYFGGQPAVWHKEILFALQQGVRVLGAASLGALRAAECHAFGMEPVGGIATAYLDGTFDDDSLVALTHGPAELDFLPLTEPMVDCLATLDVLVALGHVTPPEHAALVDAARALHFSERTVEAIAERSGIAGVAGFVESYRRHFVCQKQRDAIELLDRLELVEGPFPAPAWKMREPPSWRAFTG